MSTVCVRLFIHLHAYMCVCVCVCVWPVYRVCVCVCVLEGRIITHCLRALSFPSSSAKGLTQIWLKDNM